jgi:hypothetical protein
VAVQLPPVQDPRNFDWNAAVAASLKSKGERRLREGQEIQMLAAALEIAEGGARIDKNTPEDGHCLFHALAAGGLLSDIPESLTVDELRTIALHGATMAQLQTAAAGTGDEGITVEEYVEGMRQGLYGDNLIIGLLAVQFQRTITVIRRDYTRTFLPNGEEKIGTDDEAIWIAHYGEAHFFGVLRAGYVAPPLAAQPAPAEEGKCPACLADLFGGGHECGAPGCRLRFSGPRPKEAAASAATRGQTLVVRSRLDTACGGLGKRRVLRNSKLWLGSAICSSR